jgi:putative transcriptional regulator
MIRSRLHDLMQERKLKAAELARLADINRSTVSALMAQRATRVELDALERICIVLGCSIGDLLQIVPDEPIGQRDSSIAGEI